MNFEQMVEQETQRLIEHGRADGLRDGLREGAAALREAVADLCEAYGVELTEARREHLAGLDLAGLQELRARLKAARSWPAG
jgi:flagellar biosynthesis/type III secretory pathway protein FliH